MTKFNKKKYDKKYLKNLKKLGAQLVGKYCLFCKIETGEINKEKLDYHHHKETGMHGTGRGQKRRFHEIVKRPDCFIRLCKSHHIREHRRMNQETLRLLNLINECPF